MLSTSDFEGCCGANILYHFKYTARENGENNWSVSILARNLKELEDEQLVRPLWSFTHSSAQDEHPFSPRSLATWLREQGEYVRGTNWIKHDRHNTRIVGYMWHMSPRFRTQLKKAIAALG